MILHFYNARLIDPEAGTDGPGGLLVEAGVIKEVLTRDAEPKGKKLTAVNPVDCGGRCLAPGIVDVGVKIGEPGERHRESFRSAGLAAAAGGVTTIVARPDTQPPLDTPEALE
ncbi:MAG: dihydroorotase, partial [Gemmobacter sp.]